MFRDMFQRTIRHSLVAIILCAGALAQQPPDAAKAAENHLQWRKYRAASLMDDWGELSRYRADNLSLPAPAAGERRVVFFGDSITDIWKLPQFFPGKPYINRGISAQTTPQLLVRFRQDVIDLKPSAVVILAGTNDIASNTGPMTLEQIEENYASIAELAQVHHIAVVFSSVLPINNYTPRAVEFFLQRSPVKILELNRWLKAYCAANGHVYLDYFSPMVDDKGLLRRDLAEDGLHPNDLGYRIMAPLAEEAIAKALKQTARK